MADTYSLRVRLKSDETAGEPLLRLVVEDTAHWIRQELDSTRSDQNEIGNFPYYCQLRLPDQSLLIDGEASNEWEYWRLRWNYPDSERPVRWDIDLRLTALDEEVEFDIYVRGIPLELGGARRQLDAEPPPIVATVLSKYQAYIRGWPVSDKHQLIDETGVDDFVQNVLMAEERQIPVVVVSPRSGLFVVQVALFAQRLAGIAAVIAIRNNRASDRLVELLGDRFACSGGAIREYWPRLDPHHDSPSDHAFWLEHTIASSPLSFNRTLINRYTSYISRVLGGTERLWDSVSNIARQMKIEALRLGADDADAARVLLLEQNEKYNELLSENQELRSRHQEVQFINEDLLLRIEELESENEQHRANLRESWLSRVDAGSTVGINGETESIQEAVQRASQLPGVRFLSSAFRSSAESPYKDPHEVYSGFLALSELSRERIQPGGLGTSPTEWLKKRGIEYSGKLGERTTNEFRQSYEFHDDGRNILMEEHLKFGSDRDPRNCLRVYMCWDDADQCWIIGWVGEHLPNTKS